MAIRCRFVDSISASPTVRLDLNDTTGAGFWLGSGGLDAPPPSLRRAEASTILRDGGIVAASAYDNRTVTLPVTITSAASMDARNTLVSSLVRELNRESNILEYRPDGSSTSYFFRTFRSPELEQAMWLAKQPEATVSLVLLAEPFAYGLRVDQAGATVNNNPAAGSNGCYIDMNGVTGDVETPAFVAISSNTSTGSPAYLSVRRRGTPSALTFAFQAEAAAVQFETAVSASNDATASGAGNNYAITTPASSATNPRLTFTVGAGGAELRGTYRVIMRVKKSVAGDAWSFNLRVGNNTSVTPVGSAVTTTTSTTNWQAIYLGLVQFPAMTDSPTGYSGTSLSIATASALTLYSARTSGAGTVSYDYLLLLPADEGLAVVSTDYTSGTDSTVLDGPNDATYALRSGVFDNSIDAHTVTRDGSIPLLRPGNNRLYFYNTGTSSIAAAATLAVSFWPRYLTV